MKIYIAGASKELETAEKWIKECKDIGIGNYSRLDT